MEIPAPVSSAYCVGFVGRLIISALSDITDAQGNLLFKVDRKKFFSSNKRRVLRDSYGQPVVLLKNKKARILGHPNSLNIIESLEPSFSARQDGFRIPCTLDLTGALILDKFGTWKVYRGEIESDGNLLFTIKRKTQCMQLTKYDIFLSTSDLSKPDFQVKTHFCSSIYDIEYGEMPIAQASRNVGFLSKAEYDVAVRPGVDQAFIAAVVVIIGEIMSQASARAVSGAA